MYEAHQNRINELDDELQRCDTEIETLLERSLSDPKGSAEMLAHSRSRRAVFNQERTDLVDGLGILMRRERNTDRVAQRHRGRETLKIALGSPEKREELASKLDAAAKVFLETMDEINVLGGQTVTAVCQAARATAMKLTEPHQAQQRRMMIDGTVPHAGGFTGPAMQYALVIFLARLLERVETSQNIAKISGGWQFDDQSAMPFAQAAQMANESMAHGAQRIETGLMEPT